MSIPLGVGDARFHYHGDPGPADTVYLGVFRKEVFDQVGLFDELMVRNQDYEMNYRIRKAGGLVYFDPRLRVEYRPRSSLAGLWKQYLHYGRWKRTVLAKHPQSLRPRQLAPPLAVLGLLGSLIAAGQNVLWLAFPGLYAATLLGAAVWLAIRRHDGALLLTAPALAIMHIAWGLGFLSARPIRKAP
jgi:GT2 family glycosyltransferase